MERKTIRRIRGEVQAGKIPAEFTPAQVNATLGISWAGTFLAKHRVGNPGGDTELFIRVRKGLYRPRNVTGG